MNQWLKLFQPLANVPLDRLYGKINNIKAALSDEATKHGNH